MKYILYLLLLACIWVSPIALAQDSCNQTSYGKCFTIHARFAVYTADGVEDLWPVGSHRLLRVTAGSDRLYALLGDRPSDFFIFGDFVVCPLQKETPGHMRRVCIKQMRNLRRVKR